MPTAGLQAHNTGRIIELLAADLIYYKFYGGRKSKGSQQPLGQNFMTSNMANLTQVHVS
jgi:hypothetical protein